MEEWNIFTRNCGSRHVSSDDMFSLPLFKEKAAACGHPKIADYFSCLSCKASHSCVKKGCWLASGYKLVFKGNFYYELI